MELHGWAARPARMRLVLIGLIVLGTAGCVPAPAGEFTVRGEAVAGPTCPVVTDPPDPECEDRPVANAEVVVRDEAGAEVTTARTGEDGSFSLVLAPGRYQVVPQPVEGLMGTAATVDLVIAESADPPPLVVSYDTGIR